MVFPGSLAAISSLACECTRCNTDCCSQIVCCLELCSVEFLATSVSLTRLRKRMQRQRVYVAVTLFSASRRAIDTASHAASECEQLICLREYSAIFQHMHAKMSIGQSLAMFRPYSFNIRMLSQRPAQRVTREQKIKHLHLQHSSAEGGAVCSPPVVARNYRSICEVAKRRNS